MASQNASSFDFEGLRQRNKPQKVDPAEASELVGRLNEEEKTRSKDRKTFGRTDNGTVFVVPDTHDMVSQLLSPGQPKNIGDVVILAILAFHIAIFWYTPAPFRSWILGFIFAAWRVAYDVGIGYLLDVQSKHKRLITWAQKLNLFVDPKTGKNSHPRLYNFVKRELETKIVKDYKMEDAPIEYNTWLVFRRVVDLVLMSDFVSYSLLAISLGIGERPIRESLWVTALRWTGGSLMILFNIWVKLDAHRVVKDFAWYWGDVFFLVPQKLVFDGVFQMAPHPMYSVGYIGYYGIAAIAKSYPLLFVSIAAHLLQFAFLFIVEMPHMDKTYPEEPEPRQHQSSGKKSAHPSNDSNDYQPLSTSVSPPVPNLIGLGNMDLCRIADVLGVLIPVYCALGVATMPSNSTTQVLFVLHAFFWRLWYAGGLGFILHCESARKLWTRHFVKHGGTVDDGWRRWKEAYFVSERMAQATFVAAACKLYTVPSDWFRDYTLLKHVIAVALICLQLTVAASIYDTLGEFGWFYGDFFYPGRNKKLNYNKGPYRYLNNPELFAGMAGLWGAVLLTESRMIFALTFLTHTLAFIFHYAVERPHQRRLYRNDLRKDSGVVMTFKPYMPELMAEWDFDTVLDDFVDRMESFLDHVAPRLLARWNEFIRKSTTFLHRLPLQDLDSNIKNINPHSYSIELVSGKAVDGPLTIQYGVPIKVRWTAPSNHSPKDWIGFYSVSHNPHRHITSVSSQGRWIPTTAGQFSSSTSDSGIITSDISSDKNPDQVTGEIEFSSDKLFWETGTYELRYHHNGKHNVLSISQPFEITISHFDDSPFDIETSSSSFLSAIESVLLSVVQNCFDRDPLAPKEVDDGFGHVIEKNGEYSQRTVYAIGRMFGIELDAEVVKMDGSVRNIAWRIVAAKRVLAPFSLSGSRGRSTPVG